VVNITPRPLYLQGSNPGTGSWVGPKARLDGFGEEKIPCLCQNSNPGSSILKPGRCTNFANLIVGCECVSEVTVSTTRARFWAVTSELEHNGLALNRCPRLHPRVGLRRPEHETSCSLQSLPKIRTPALLCICLWHDV
jgi:hypothetical protein